jgi:hypothetical protein
MFDVKFWEEIKTDFPKGYEIFCNETGYKLYNVGNNEFYMFKENDADLCYCDLEAYFDGLGINIEIIKFRMNPKIFETDNPFFKEYDFLILNKNVLFSGKLHDIEVNSTEEAKLAAVKKAFEIREDQLKDGK